MRLCLVDEIEEWEWLLYSHPNNSLICEVFSLLGIHAVGNFNPQSVGFGKSN